jgi:hypothetical protein
MKRRKSVPAPTLTSDSSFNPVTAVRRSGVKALARVPFHPTTDSGNGGLPEPDMTRRICHSVALKILPENMVWGFGTLLRRGEREGQGWESGAAGVWDSAMPPGVLRSKKG